MSLRVLVLLALLGLTQLGSAQNEQTLTLLKKLETDMEEVKAERIGKSDHINIDAF